MPKRPLFGRCGRPASALARLAEQLDPEDWHQIFDRFFQLLAEGVHRFEGTVNQCTGDGFMALFDAPLAHVDNTTQRACRAALHLTEARRFSAMSQFWIQGQLLL